MTDQAQRLALHVGQLAYDKAALETEVERLQNLLREAEAQSPAPEAGE